MEKHYPFEHLRAKAYELDTFKQTLPNVFAAMPELFRAMAIAHKSIAQRDMYGMPQGIRQDLGFETSVKLLLVACFQDRQLAQGAIAALALEVFRSLTLKWYRFGNDLDSCLYFGYFAYTCNSNAIYLLNDCLKQSAFLGGDVDGRQKESKLHTLFAPSHSHAWYKTNDGIGDKSNTIWIADSDLTKTGLPKPGYQVHFRSSSQYDLRAPIFIPIDEVETPVISQGKVVVSCPHCRQKCRGNLFKQIEVACPNCKTRWTQFTS